MEDKEVMKIAKEMLKDAINQSMVIYQLTKLEKAIDKAKSRIREKRFRGTPRTLNDDELAHNGALSIAIRIIDEAFEDVRNK